MHYKALDSIVRTEYTAKSPSQASGWLVRYLRKNVNRNDTVLDYGCGKLRYTGPLSRAGKSVVAVDSREQIQRLQTIDGTCTTVRDYAGSRHRNVRVFSLEEPGWQSRRYDFLLCANVLSAVPHRDVRVGVLRRMRAVARRGARVLIVVQYTNSYFREARSRGVAYQDGWLIRGASGAAFYAPLSVALLTRLATAAGLHVKDAWRSGQSAVVLAAA